MSSRAVPPEPAVARLARHERVAARRAGTLVICHRGASAFAPENTLEAYAAAMDYGADGCEAYRRALAKENLLPQFYSMPLSQMVLVEKWPWRAC